MWFSAMAYVLVDTLRRVGLRFTQFADASAQTIRLRLLRLGAQVRTSVRRIPFAIASGCPNKAEFELAHLYLQRAFSSPDGVTTPKCRASIRRAMTRDVTHTH